MTTKQSIIAGNYNPNTSNQTGERVYVTSVCRDGGWVVTPYLHLARKFTKAIATRLVLARGQGKAEVSTEETELEMRKPKPTILTANIATMASQAERAGVSTADMLDALELGVDTQRQTDGTWDTKGMAHFEIQRWMCQAILNSGGGSDAVALYMEYMYDALKAAGWDAMSELRDALERVKNIS